MQAVGATRSSGTDIRFHLRVLNPTRRGVWPVSLNDFGVVAGDLTKLNTVFLDTAGHLKDLGRPPGSSSAAVIGLSDDNRLLVTAGTDSRSRWFVAVPRSNQMVWIPIRSNVPGYKVTDVAAIDAKGLIVGTVRRLHAGPARRSERPAVWLPKSGAYSAAHLLPLKDGYSGGRGETIWNQGRRVVIAGCGDTRSQEAVSCMLLWARAGTDAYRLGQGIATETSGIDLLACRGSHIYAGGEGGNGYDLGWGWAGRLTGTKAGPPSVDDLPRLEAPPGSGLFWGLGGLAVSPSGRMVAVGNNGGSPDSAVLWLPSRRPAFLQDLLPPNSGWTLERGVAINMHGQVLTLGAQAGRTHTLLLTPTAGWR